MVVFLLSSVLAMSSKLTSLAPRYQDRYRKRGGIGKSSMEVYLLGGESKAGTFLGSSYLK